MIRIYLLGLLLLINCNSINLKPVTSQEILKEVRSYKGDKAVLVNVWATWCKPCIEEFPMIVDLEKDLSEYNSTWRNTYFNKTQFEQLKLLTPTEITLTNNKV